jgi:5-enolpyruvylshikimate-3-phosphate synthase
LAPVAVYVPGVVIDGCEAVSKSYPDYWRQLQKIGFRIEEVEE